MHFLINQISIARVGPSFEHAKLASASVYRLYKHGKQQ